MPGLEDKPFINIAYEMNNIRIYYIEHTYWAYCVDAENISPITDKRAHKITKKILERTNGCHMTNLLFAYPNTFKESTKIKIKELCKNQSLSEPIMLKMLLCLI